MHFLTPLAFAFAASIPVVILFYLLKRKRVVKLISSTVLWQRFLAETQANAPFQRLRHNWLLLLQILMLALAVFALARPFFAAPTKQGRLLVAILDVSASMQSTDAPPSRFESARTELGKWVDSLHDTDRMVLLQAGASTQVKQSPTSSKVALRRAIQSCSISDGPTRLTEALKLSETLTRDQPLAEIHLFSDGAAPGLSEFENKGMRLVYHRIGSRCENVGIVSMDVRAHPEDPKRRALYANLANCSTNARQTGVELRLDGQLLESKTVTFKGKEVAPLVFLANQSKDGVFTLHLTDADDLAVDNDASMVSLMPQPTRILLVSKGNRFLEKALRAAPGAQLTTATELRGPASSFDLVVLDDCMPASWPVQNVLAVHVGNTNLLGDFKRIENPSIVDWKNTHPLLRFVNFDNVQIAETLGIAPPPWAVTLVESPQTPLILAGEYKRQRVIWIGFDLLQSTWPLRIAFPIFIANAVEWLNPAASTANQLLVKAGDPFRFLLAEPATNLTAVITLPDKTQKNIAVENGSRELVYGDTARQGVYRAHFGTNDLAFCVNLLDSAESDTAPRGELSLGKYGKVSSTSTKRANLECWRWFALAGLFVLLFEWWYYHRRTV
jgi:hypothetical protein